MYIYIYVYIYIYMYIYMYITFLSKIQITNRVTNILKCVFTEKQLSLNLIVTIKYCRGFQYKFL